MEINLHTITIRDLAENYIDSGSLGVKAYNGKLDVRPAYQREFVYSGKQREAVIDTVRKGFPLNTIYWLKRDNPQPGEPLYEVMDGQQRIISICQYVTGKFSVGEDIMFFENLPSNKQKELLDYELQVYFCEGNASEKLDWFKIINIAGEELTDQELRNAIYAGPWLTSAKDYFSKPQCPAIKDNRDKYLKGNPIRQEILEKALSWISNGKITQYMAVHQFDQTAYDLWQYFTGVIDWVKAVFPKYRKEMKGLPWGDWYNTYRNEALRKDPLKTEAEVSRLMEDDDVTSKKGIYEYILDGKEKHLNIRAFDKAMKRSAFERQHGKCAICHKVFKIEDMEADHIKPWSLGGKTVAENCQMLCKDCNREKSNK